MKITEKMKNRQYRGVEIVLDTNSKRIESDYYVEGYAARFEAYPLFQDNDGNVIYERFEKDCFNETDMTDIIFQYNHEGRVYARKSNGTLSVEVDENGLFIAADLSKSADGRNLYEEIENGLTTKMSWGFVPKNYYYDKDNRTIVHTSIKKIYDVSAVSIPANQDTDIHARSFVDGVIAKEHEEFVERENKIKKLELIIKLQGEL